MRARASCAPCPAVPVPRRAALGPSWEAAGAEGSGLRAGRGDLYAPGGRRGSPHRGNLAVGAGPPSRVPRRPGRWRAAAEVGAGAEAVVGAGYSMRRHLGWGVGGGHGWKCR